MPWLTASINPPALDVAIIGKKESLFGYSPTYEIFEFDSKMFTAEEAEAHMLSNGGFKLWKKVEDDE